MEINYRFNDEMQAEYNQIFAECEKEKAEMSKEEREENNYRLRNQADNIIKKFAEEKEKKILEAVDQKKVREFMSLCKKAVEFAKNEELNIYIPEPSNISGKIVFSFKYFMLVEEAPIEDKNNLLELIKKSCYVGINKKDDMIELELWYKFYDGEF